MKGANLAKAEPMARSNGGEKMDTAPILNTAVEEHQAGGSHNGPESAGNGTTYGNPARDTLAVPPSLKKRLPNKGSFKPGNTASRSGKRTERSFGDLRQALKQSVPIAVKALQEIAKDQRHRDRAKAAIAVLDRYYGTPIQTHQTSLTITHELAEIERRIMANDPTWIPRHT